MGSSPLAANDTQKLSLVNYDPLGWPSCNTSLRTHPGQPTSRWPLKNERLQGKLLGWAASAPGMGAPAGASSTVPGRGCRQEALLKVFCAFSQNPPGSWLLQGSLLVSGAG